jgi:hypothetical protein
MDNPTVKQSGEGGFAALGSFEGIKVQQRAQAGNIIKASQVVSRGAHAIELHENPDNLSSVVIHRDGERVDRVEFVCICGRGTTLRLEYDGE